MKLASRFTAITLSLFLSLSAFGGSGSGGTFSGAKFKLQSFDSELAVLTFEGSTNIPESVTAPRIVVSADEYGDFLKEAEYGETIGEPFVLAVEGEVTRYFELRQPDLSETDGVVVLYLVEVAAPVAE